MKQEITDKFIEIIAASYSHRELDIMMKKIAEQYKDEIYIKPDANSSTTWGLTKKFRVENFIKFLEKNYNSTTAIKMISEYILDPIKWLNNEEKYNEYYTKINKLLNIGGFEVNKQGKMQKVNAINTIKALNEKWKSFTVSLEEFKNKDLINNEIIEFCKKEADKDFYYHVVDQVAKHLEEKIKNHLYLNIGDERKKAWNLLEEYVEIKEKQRPIFITDNYNISNKTQISSSKDYQNGYVLYVKGILKFIRNVYAHTSRKNMHDITKNEALSLLVILSKSYDFIDSLKRIV